MVRIRNYKIICILLALVVIISGMCLESIRTDSIFACAPIEAADSPNISFDTIVRDVDFCTTKMLGIRNNIRIQQFVGQEISKGMGKLSLVLSYLYPGWISSGKFSASYELVQVFKVYQEEIVLNYIHKSDGKKRI